MADTPEISAVEIINSIADSSCDLRTVAALRMAQTALRRIAAIKAAHSRYEKTYGSTLLWPPIHGLRLHQLLYGDVNEI